MSILLISFSSKSTAPKAVLGAIEQQQRILELDENEKAIFGLKRWDWTIDEKQVLSYGNATAVVVGLCPAELWDADPAAAEGLWVSSSNVGAIML